MMVCSTCVAKLQQLGVPYKLKLSPHTGRLTPMVQTRPLLITDPYTNPADYQDNFRQQLTDHIVTDYGVDGYCDTADFLGTDLQTTWYPSVWAAVDVSTFDGELYVLGTDGSLLEPISTFMGALLAIITSNPFLVGVFVLIPLLIITWVVVAYLSKEPLYWAYNPATHQYEKMPWSQYVTAQNTNFWYVCGSGTDIYGIGDKSIYASPADVPADQVALWKSHCANAPDISPPSWLQGILMQIVYVAVAVGAVYLAIKLLPPLFSSRRNQYD